MDADDTLHEDKWTCGPMFFAIIDSRDLYKFEFGIVVFGSYHILNLGTEVTLFDNIVEITNKRAEDSDIQIPGPPIGDMAIQESDGVAATSELGINRATFEFENDGFAVAVARSLKDEGDHATVEGGSIDVDIIGSFDRIDCSGIDFLGGVAHSGVVGAKFCTELGTESEGRTVRQRLKDFGEENVVVAEEPESSLIEKCLVAGQIIPEIVGACLAQKAKPCT